MGLRHRYVRLLSIAVTALLGIVSSAQEASAGPVGPQRAAAMLRAGCCCVVARADCCCEGGTPVRLTPRQAGEGPARLLMPAPRDESGPRSGSCQCRSADPARPPSNNPSPSSEDEQSRVDHTAAAVDISIAALPGAPRFSADRPHLSPPKAPLYLRTARLLI